MVEAPLPGMIDSIIERRRLNAATTLQVFNIEKSGAAWNCLFKDGSREIPGGLSSKAHRAIGDDGLDEGGVVRIQEYVGNTSEDGSIKLMVFELVVLSKTPPPKVEVKAEPLAVKMEGTAENEPKPESQPELESKPSDQGNKENVAPYKTPAAKKMAKFANTPGFTPPSTGRRSVLPIQALNPYNTVWSIKAKVTAKGPVRSLSRNGQSFNLFSISLVDQDGSEIEATLWRDLADQWSDRMEEGKVYIISKGRVKPANKTYATTRCDYALDLSLETQIEECGEEDASKMQVKVKYVALDQLHSFIGKKMTVDILAVVKEVQPLGSVKRKSDGVDLPRRDLTLVDQSGKMARLTTWNSLAEDKSVELEALTYPVVSFTAIRVGDYDGVSLSTVSRTQMQINPDTPEARDMRTWWESQGSTTEFIHAGAGLASARKDGKRDVRSWLVDALKDPAMLPSPDAKPEYHNVRCTIMKIDPDQTPFFYAADTATGKKVVEDGSGWRFAADDSPCTSMAYRYFVRVQVMDATGTAEVILSNDQAEKLMGQKADEIREMRETDREKFQAVVDSPKFTEWNMTLRTSTREYKGELKLTISVVGSLVQDYIAESKWLIAQIQALAV